MAEKQTLEHYIPKQKTVTYCAKCGSFKFGKCRLGYATKSTSKACRQAIEPGAKRSF
jgi:tRNA(Ile)-lysidine synthase TilS/MesJ